MTHGSPARLYELLGVSALSAAGLLSEVVLPLLAHLPDMTQALLLTHVQVRGGSRESRALYTYRMYRL